MKQRADSGAPGRYWLLERTTASTASPASPLSPRQAIPQRSRPCGAITPTRLPRRSPGRGTVFQVSSARHPRRRLSQAAGRASEDGRGRGGRTTPVRARRLVQPRLCRAAPTRRSLRAEMMIKWWSAFQVETGLPVSDVSRLSTWRCRSSALCLGRRRRRCMARHRTTRRHFPDRSVFTPPQWRRRGTRRRASGHSVSGFAARKVPTRCCMPSSVTPARTPYTGGSASKQSRKCSPTGSTTSSTADETSFSFRAARPCLRYRARWPTGPFHLGSTSS